MPFNSKWVVSIRSTNCLHCQARRCPTVHGEYDEVYKNDIKVLLTCFDILIHHVSNHHPQHWHAVLIVTVLLVSQICVKFEWLKDPLVWTIIWSFGNLLIHAYCSRVCNRCSAIMFQQTYLSSEIPKSDAHVSLKGYNILCKCIFSTFAVCHKPYSIMISRVRKQSLVVCRGKCIALYDTDICKKYWNWLYNMRIRWQSEVYAEVAAYRIKVPKQDCNFAESKQLGIRDGVKSSLK